MDSSLSNFYILKPVAFFFFFLLFIYAELLLIWFKCDFWITRLFFLDPRNSQGRKGTSSLTVFICSSDWCHLGVPGLSHPILLSLRKWTTEPITRQRRTLFLLRGSASDGPGSTAMWQLHVDMALRRWAALVTYPSSFTCLRFESKCVGYSHSYTIFTLVLTCSSAV